MPSDPVSHILSRLQHVKKSGQGWMARCPSHDDSTKSLKVDPKPDRILLHCHVGCRAADIVKALGLSMADLFLDRSISHGQTTSREPQKRITFAELACHKRPPVDWLANALGWHNLPNGGVGIPYRDREGKTWRAKHRVALTAKEGSAWDGQQDKGIIPYGLDALCGAGVAGDSLIAIEGETDYATLRYHGFPAIGIPGANNAKVIAREHVEDFATIYVWREPDAGGKTFVKGLTKRLAELGYKGSVKVIHVEGIKDPSEL